MESFLLDILTPEEIAKILKVPKKIVYQLIEEEKIRAISVGEYIRVCSCDLFSFLGLETPMTCRSIEKYNKKTKGISTVEVIRILDKKVPRGEFIDVTKIQELVYKEALKEKLLSERDLKGENHIGKSSYPRYKHICQASLQRLKNEGEKIKNEMGNSKFGIYVAEHKDRMYKFV